MQYAKDSFYMALRGRLAVVNPLRTVTLFGIVRPALVVAENEPGTADAPLTEVFYMRFGAVQPVGVEQAAKRPMLALNCEITYRTQGTAGNNSIDRGRLLATLDLELLQIAAPAWTEKQNYTATPAVDLGTRLLWQRPQFAAIEEVGNELRRQASITIFFFPEMDF